MPIPTDNENWIIDIAAEIIQRKANAGFENLSAKEKLIYCLWIADYGMRNAGDLQTAHDLFPSFQSEGRRIADELFLSITSKAFSLSQLEFQKMYFELFDLICDEIQNTDLTRRCS
jgi:hypothetical protein